MVRRFAGLAFLGSMLITTSAGGALPPVAAAIDLLAMIAARSPGEREAGVLSNKKARVPLSAPGGVASLWTPEAPIPDAVPLPPDPGALSGAGLGGGAPGGPEGVGGTDRFGSDENFLPGFPGGGGFPVGGGPVGFIPPGGTPGNPGGGGGGIPPGGGGTTPPGNPPVTPVPEPGAWILMLASVALAGAHLRRRTRTQRPTQCA
jgi:hypothetical protein